MSTHINANILKNFIVKTIGSDKLSESKSRDFEVDSKEFKAANDNDNNYLEIDEIINDKDLYEQFATMFVEEQEKQDATDSEKEKEEKNKVKDKNGASKS